MPSNEIVYERCVAHFVKSGGNSKFNLTGFLMGAGDGNIARGCVATGIQGGAESSAGFHWPSHSRNDQVWTFEDNLAHNNRHSGIYFWQNGVPRTIVDRFTAYHSGQGIFAGSYPNLVSYRDCTLYANARVRADHLRAAVPPRAGARARRSPTRACTSTRPACPTTRSRSPSTWPGAPSDRVTLITGGTFMGGNKAQVGLPEGGNHPQLYDFVD